MQYAAEQNIPDMLLFVDFEKAFDSLSLNLLIILFRCKEKPLNITGLISYLTSAYKV